MFSNRVQIVPLYAYIYALLMIINAHTVKHCGMLSRIRTAKIFNKLNGIHSPNLYMGIEGLTSDQEVGSSNYDGVSSPNRRLPLWSGAENTGHRWRSHEQKHTSKWEPLFTTPMKCGTLYAIEKRWCANCIYVLGLWVNVVYLQKKVVQHLQIFNNFWSKANAFFLPN